ncbi:MAG: AraC family transcriptional regulator [Oscillospiraceae bacterium]|nr:AraC family transcriptional regulator [Oscillospiraceae bacterium]
MKSYIVSNLHSIDLTVYQLGTEECRPLHSFGPAIRNHYLFHYIWKGKGIVYTDNAEFHLLAGQGFLIWPGQEYLYCADQNDPWHYSWVEFDGFKASELMLSAGFSATNPIYTSNDKIEQEKMKNAFLNILEYSENQPLELIGYLYLLLSALIASSDLRKEVSSVSLRDFYVQEAIYFIEGNYSNRDMTVQDIAIHCRLDRSYMGKIFKVAKGLSLKEFLVRYRINKACELLQTTNHPISKISNMVGYSDIYSFSRAFRASMNVPPSQWRSANRILTPPTTG